MDFYDIRSGDTILFKRRIRPLRVKLMDDAVKTVMVDEAQNVSEVVETICKRIGINQSDEYSLRMEAPSAAAGPSGGKLGSIDNLTETMKRGGKGKAAAEEGVLISKFGPGVDC